MRIGLRIACVLLACLPGLRAADPPPAEDPWTGKSRDDLLTLLGEPTKKKADGKGSELWAYKLVRLDPDLPPEPGVMVLERPRHRHGRPVARTRHAGRQHATGRQRL